MGQWRFSPRRKSLNLAPKRFSPSSEDFLPGENLIAIILASKFRNLYFLPAGEIFSQEKISEFGPKEIFSQLRRFSPRRKSLSHHSSFQISKFIFSPSSGDFLPAQKIFSQEKISTAGRKTQ